MQTPPYRPYKLTSVLSGASGLGERRRARMRITQHATRTPCSRTDVHRFVSLSLSLSLPLSPVATLAQVRNLF